jgi:hypothetical protein
MMKVQSPQAQLSTLCASELRVHLAIVNGPVDKRPGGRGLKMQWECSRPTRLFLQAVLEGKGFSASLRGPAEMRAEQEKEPTFRMSALSNRQIADLRFFSAVSIPLQFRPVVVDENMICRHSHVPSAANSLTNTHSSSSPSAVSEKESRWKACEFIGWFGEEPILLCNRSPIDVIAEAATAAHDHSAAAASSATSRLVMRGVHDRSTPIERNACDTCSL